MVSNMEFDEMFGFDSPKQQLRCIAMVESLIRLDEYRRQAKDKDALQGYDKEPAQPETQLDQSP